jgi:hypothetical protein
VKLMTRTGPALALLCATLPSLLQAYPLDDYARTGIRRLDYAVRVESGEIPGRRLQPGQYLPSSAIAPRWSASDGQQLPSPDPDFGRKLSLLLDAKARPDYGIAVLDLSDPGHPLYGAHNADLRANIGSVGKIMVALALFQQLADLYPDDIAARERVLRETNITADIFSQYDHHHVVFWNPETRKRQSRSIRIGDRGSLWEYLDWMLSASSNSAAGMVQKELIALRHFGRAYPPGADQKAAFFADTPRTQLGALMRTTMDTAGTRNGLDPEQLRQGSFFTRSGNQRIPTTSSYGTPQALVEYLFRLEAGTLVDSYSSAEIKRLLYMTQRRIRYASHPALNDAAVYFKSGSFFQCLKPGSCAKYKGDKTNRLASIAIVESPAGAPRLHYLVAVMSNVLYVNSAVAHQTLAMRIHRLIEKLHPQPDTATSDVEPAYPAAPVDDNDDTAPVAPNHD